MSGMNREIEIWKEVKKENDMSFYVTVKERNKV